MNYNLFLRKRRNRNRLALGCQLIKPIVYQFHVLVMNHWGADHKGVIICHIIKRISKKVLLKNIVWNSEHKVARIDTQIHSQADCSRKLLTHLVFVIWSTCVRYKWLLEWSVLCWNEVLKEIRVNLYTIVGSSPIRKSERGASSSRWRNSRKKRKKTKTR